MHMLLSTYKQHDRHTRGRSIAEETAIDTFLGESMSTVSVVIPSIILSETTSFEFFNIYWDFLSAQNYDQFDDNGYDIFVFSIIW